MVGIIAGALPPYNHTTLINGPSTLGINLNELSSTHSFFLTPISSVTPFTKSAALDQPSSRAVERQCTCYAHGMNKLR
jgi:hypothetical protein